MLFLCYPKCSTCQKAKKWLDEYNIEYTERQNRLFWKIRFGFGVSG